MGKSGAGERRSIRVSTKRRVAAKAPADKTNGSRDAAAARANILAIATEEFSKKGLSGSRVDEIAERTHTVKRMIYYYFGSKDGLYRAVLERAYEDIRSLEVSLDLDAMAPDEALRALVRATFDYHTKHPDFVRLVMNENIHHGDHIGHLSNIKARRSTVLVMLRKLIDRGVAARLFRHDLDPSYPLLKPENSVLAFDNLLRQAQPPAAAAGSNAPSLFQHTSISPATAAVDPNVRAFHSRVYDDPTATALGLPQKPLFQNVTPPPPPPTAQSIQALTDPFGANAPRRKF